jgi:hypothetical protein
MKVYAIAIPRGALCRALPPPFAYWVLTDREWTRHTRETLVAVSAVKVWLRDYSVLADGIQAKAPVLHRAHQFLYVSTTPIRHRSGGLRGDARDRAERRTHRSPCGITRGFAQNEDDGDLRGGDHKRDKASGRLSGRALDRERDAAQEC